MIPHTGTILGPTASHEDDAVLLDIVTLAGDVGGHVGPGRELDTGDLALSGVGLLGTDDADAQAHALHGRGVGARQGRGGGVASALALAASPEDLVESRGTGYGGREGFGADVGVGDDGRGGGGCGMSSFTRALRPALRGSTCCLVQKGVGSGVMRQAFAKATIPGSAPRCLSTTSPLRSDDLSEIPPTPISHLSEVETAMADAVSRFANEVILPKVREMDESEAMDPTLVQQLFEQGLMSVEIPEEYGGAGMNFTAAIVGIEELARVDPSVSVLVDVHNTLCNTAFLKYGSDHLKRKYLPLLATSRVASFCLSEPASGSDAFALGTKATETADGGYAISGGKMWITNAVEADVFIVFANLDPSKGYKGITAFVVDKGTPGFSIAKKEKKLGIRASSTCVLNFDDVRVPRENLLGQPGQGYKYAIGLLNEGRIGIAAQMTGLALGAWENAARYVWNDRRQFGSLVGEFQGMQHQMAQSYTEIAAARALVYNAARKKEAGEDFVRDAAMAKLYAAQVAGRVSGLAVEWMGGMGFVREGLAEKFYRDSKIGAIYEGTSNIQLNTIAKLLQKEYTS
ncbi:Acyl-CoA dehydrogenase related to the alkylation response protein AidB [Geosmithia morbida]|uniref:Short/branched chain specific acyl-CoA dehydrogenase, mitochondrial n=1 Tax=Geosmithia morbida TaxID=1094350 RepID=A0A9P5D436_9HYPO|nr:Acyl-CoA dehydrogenase related to the alkylation response protein AidB [Geosmithia morbida]KAF4126903.1 Acyl-CoA dehydrogenase related to the alkylation response protein AidB [Geosmithia morbida]